MKPDFTIDPSLLPALAAFVCVARHASFRRAALELEVSPSALSQQVRSLEQRLGTRLLQRTTRKVGLTELGEELLQEAAPALARMGTALQAMESRRGLPSGQLRITTSWYVAEQLLLPFLPAFQARYPQVCVEFSVQPAMVDVVAEGFDAGIRLGESLAAGMIAVPLGPPQQLAVVAAPAYLQQHGSPATPEALVDHRCIRYRGSTGRVMPWEFSREGRDFTIEVNGAVLVNDSRLSVQAARTGLGLSQVLRGTVLADLAAGTLVPVLDAWQPPFAGFHLYYPSREQLAPKLRVFIDFMRAALEHGAQEQR